MESFLLVLVLVPCVLSQGGDGDLQQGGDGDLPDPRCPLSSWISRAWNLTGSGSGHLCHGTLFAFVVVAVVVIIIIIIIIILVVIVIIIILVIIRQQVSIPHRSESRG